jgi:hypothetical protein
VLTLSVNPGFICLCLSSKHVESVSQATSLCVLVCVYACLILVLFTYAPCCARLRFQLLFMFHHMVHHFPFRACVYVRAVCVFGKNLHCRMITMTLLLLNLYRDHMCLNTIHPIFVTTYQNSQDASSADFF